MSRVRGRCMVPSGLGKLCDSSAMAPPRPWRLPSCCCCACQFDTVVTGCLSRSSIIRSRWERDAMYAISTGLKAAMPLNMTALNSMLMTRDSISIRLDAPIWKVPAFTLSQRRDGRCIASRRSTCWLKRSQAPWAFACGRELETLRVAAPSCVSSSLGRDCTIILGRWSFLTVLYVPLASGPFPAAEKPGWMLSKRER